MANQKKSVGTGPVALSGETYTLYVDMNTIAELERLLNRPAHKLIANSGIFEIRGMLFQMLQEHHSKDFPNVEAVGDVLEFDGKAMADYGKAIKAAMVRFSGRDVKDAGDSDPLPAVEKTETETEEPGTGTPS